ncbi:MAG: cytochrome c maturation protein CcmE [Anaerolineae bacterium]|nr:cytochrome c maturation protein CcmE [Anaerolineae bacterium]
MNANETNTKNTGLKFNKFIIGGLVLAVAVVLLVVTSIKGSAQYYYTVKELTSGGARQSSLRVSGVVLGDTIQYDPTTFKLTFTIADIPGDTKEIEAAGGLAQVLHDAALNPNAARLEVVYKGERPDLLTNEAQAIVTGSLGDDGRFYADELLLKCPSRYEDGVPQQVQQ